MKTNRVLQYDFETLPDVPFPIYFFNRKGDVHPKKIYTVTKKILNNEMNRIDLFILELGQSVIYDPALISPVHNVKAN